MSSMYELFKTDQRLESDGIVLDYGQFRITVARAGGQNKKFAKILDTKTKPYKRAIQTETMDNERGVDILREVYAEAIILNWETKINGEFKRGIEAQDGSLLDFSKENILTTLRALPDLFADIQDQSSKASLYRQTVRETEAGN